MAIKTKADVSPSESALLWLAVVQRPFRARELWLAAHLEQSWNGNDSASLEKLQVSFKAQRYNDDQALSALHQLVGKDVLGSFSDPLDSSVIYVDLPEPGIRNVPSQESHYHVLHSLLSICFVTVMNLARIQKDTAATSLTLYAWTHWKTHFEMSGVDLKDEHWAGMLERLVVKICHDALEFLIELNNFVTEPITLSVMEDQSRCIALVREAQEALEGPMELLSSLAATKEMAKKLQGSREIFETFSFARQKGFSLSRNPDGKGKEMDSGILVDHYLHQTLSLFEKEAAHTIRQLVDVARGLRGVSAAIVQTPLYEQLLKDNVENASPLALLAKVADFLETVGTFPYWEKFSFIETSNPDTTLKTQSTLARDAASLPSLKTISPLRYCLARLVYKTRSLPSATFIINPPNLTRPSSFSHFLTSINSFNSFLPASFYNKPLPSIEPTNNPAKTSPSILNQSLLSSGYRITLFYSLSAIILNHIRTIFTPWLGQSIWFNPLSNLRLAITNPEIFLDNVSDFPWLWVVFIDIQKLLWDSTVRRVCTRPDLSRRRLSDVCRILYFTWVFSVIDLWFSRVVYTTAWWIAMRKLLGGYDAEHIALRNLMAENRVKFLFFGFNTVWYTTSSIIPLGWSSLEFATGGQPGLLILLIGLTGGVVAVIKYRSTFYIALEISGMFVFMGFLFSTVTILGVEFWTDPLGIEGSTAMARTRGGKVKRVLDGQRIDWKKSIDGLKKKMHVKKAKNC
ncbi:hypothetical protein QBC38DRAFT_488997 [Podospora fimiseda]|uniref:Uncharacterized protein n=1 Tax=Podospora fimiseda TaxID=252190 RepID=A0AAN6YQV2_9PEZI|nr:hypothetical protein QBC38DRAFT_488997 [Podospora fimiseda]